MKPFRVLALALSISLSTASCFDSGSSVPCAPACTSGETCTFGVCVVRCNPPCAPGQLCANQNGTNACVNAISTRDAARDTSDALALDDLASDGSATPDAPTADGPSSDAATIDDAAQTDAPPIDVTPLDAPLVDVTPLDAPLVDAAPVDSSLVDAAPVPDVRVDAGPPPPDAPVARRCGALSEPCCGFGDFGTACRDGLLCNAPNRGNCTDVPRESGECVSTATCMAGRVCGGPVGCADRFCFRCTLPGPRAFDSACNPAMTGRDCASGVCLNERCTYACRPGSDGDTECERYAAGSRCIAQQYGIDVDGGVPQRVITLGRCIPSCSRNVDCTEGRVCVASANVFNDRFDFVCFASTLTGLIGSTCMTDAARPTCQSGFCIADGPSTTRGHCTGPCTTDADCPAAAPVCGPLTLVRPVTGNPQSARGCLTTG